MYFETFQLRKIKYVTEHYNCVAETCWINSIMLALNFGSNRNFTDNDSTNQFFSSIAQRSARIKSLVNHWTI